MVSIFVLCMFVRGIGQTINVDLHPLCYRTVWRAIDLWHYLSPRFGGGGGGIDILQFVWTAYNEYCCLWDRGSLFMNGHELSTYIFRKPNNYNIVL